MIHSAQSRKSVMTSIFRRKSGGGGHVRLFDTLEPDLQHALNLALPIHDGELPVLGMLHDRDNWLVLTTARIAWAHDGVRTEVSLDALISARVDLSRGRLPAHVMLDDAVRTYNLRMNYDGSLAGILSIFNNVLRRNRSESSEENTGKT